MNSVKEYNYSGIITEYHHKIAINLVDNLFRSGKWHNEKDIPKFQTYACLQTFQEFEIFTKTFLKSCSQFLDMKKFSSYKVYMWCYKDNAINTFWRNEKILWHRHSEYRVEGDRISGVYYLRNPQNEGTEFENFKINPKPYTWYLYPSHLLHKPPRTKSFRSRYTLAVDLVS